MTLTQTIEVPENRQVNFNFKVPREIPTGRTNIIIQFPVTTKPDMTSSVKRKLTAAEEAEYIERNFERINAEVMEVLEDQADIFEELEKMK